MFTTSELKVMCCIGNGSNSIQDLMNETGLSQAQIYNIVRDLKDRSLIKGKDDIEISDNVCAIRLSNLLTDYPNLSNVLSGNGTDILLMLLEPHTANEIICELGISRSAVFKQLKRSISMGILTHDKDRYAVNKELWPDLSEYLISLKDQRSVIDDRIPYGSRILVNKKDHVVYSNVNETGDSHTAFSFFENEGLPIMTDTKYFSTEHDVDCNIAFRDAFDITERLNDSRFRMALLLYCLENHEKIDPPEKFRAIFEKLMSGDDVEGWPPIREVEQRRWSK